MEAVKEMAICGHFSHHHPLVHTNSPPATNVTCFGCNLNILLGKDHYQCKICPFNLHQACYDIPRKIRHPGHPIHYLSLLVMPASAKGSFRCKACGQSVTGFYYSCAECGICYHILCTALPLSVSIYSHSHILKLEYSLPYDFECDLCQKPCYNGWLYRCRLCEFDTHLACAIANQRTKSLQDPSLMRQTMYSSPALEKDHGSEESNELRQLVSQGIAVHGAVAGWHKKLHSPRQKHSLKYGSIEYSGGPFQTKEDIDSFSTNPGGHVEHLDQSNLQSGELSTLLSYQFSDRSYFSIDIARSYSHNEVNHHDSKVIEDVKQEISYSNGRMLDRITSNLEPTKEEINKLDFNMLFMGPHNRLNEAFLVTEKESRHRNKAKETGSRGSSAIKHQGLTSDKGRLKCSCWWKFIQRCYDPKYDRQDKMEECRNMTT